MSQSSDILNFHRPLHILFVCSGNVFRSMTAKYSLDDYLVRNPQLPRMVVRSAGITARPQPKSPTTIASLQALGIDPSSHAQHKLTVEDIAWADLVVAMAPNHVEFIKHMGVSKTPAHLFNDICFGEKTMVEDIEDAVVDWKTNTKSVEKHINWTVNYIYDSMPAFCANLDRFLRH